jgi:hypothetical protein
MYYPSNPGHHGKWRSCCDYRKARIGSGQRAGLGDPWGSKRFRIVIQGRCGQEAISESLPGAFGAEKRFLSWIVFAPQNKRGLQR